MQTRMLMIPTDVADIAAAFREDPTAFLAFLGAMVEYLEQPAFCASVMDEADHEDGADAALNTWSDVMTDLYNRGR